MSLSELLLLSRKLCRGGRCDEVSPSLHLNLILILKSPTGDPLGFIVLAALSDCDPGNDYPTFTTSEHQNGRAELSLKIYPNVSGNQEKEQEELQDSRLVAGTLFDLSVCRLRGCWSCPVPSDIDFHG